MNRLSLVIRRPRTPLPFARHIFAYSTKPQYDESKLQEIIGTSNVGQSRSKPEEPKQSEELKFVENEIAQAEALQKDGASRLENVQQRLAQSSAHLSKTITDTLPKAAEQKQQEWTEKLRARLVELSGTLSVASKTLNEVTGYASIEKLKLTVEDLEEKLRQARAAVKLAKHRYAEAIQQRSELQKEINELLTRKHLWTSQDVERFTELYRSDHTNQQEESDAEKSLEEAEQAAEHVQVMLTTLILTRYHEEQIWSDKIRQVLTWGTWMLMGVNIVLFATATFLVEPWKRKKLVNAFHEAVEGKLEESAKGIETLSAMLSTAKETAKEPAKEPVAVREPGTSHKIAFTVTSWTAFVGWVKLLVAALRDPATRLFLVEKPDLAILSGTLVATGFGLGSLATVAFARLR